MKNILLTLLTFITITLNGQQDIRSIHSDLQKAMNLSAKLELDSANLYFDRYFRISESDDSEPPRNPIVYLTYGTILSLQDDPDNAERIWTEGIENSHVITSKDAYNVLHMYDDLVSLHVREYDIGKSSETVEQLIINSSDLTELVPSKFINGIIALSRGRVSHLRGEYENAIVLFQNGLRLVQSESVTPELSALISDIYNQKGLSHYFIGQYDDALNDFKRSISSNHNETVEPYFNSVQWNNTALALWGVAKEYYKAGYPERGRKTMQEAEKLYDKAITTWEKTIDGKKLLGRMINNKAMIYDDIYIFEKDTTAYFTAHKIYQKSLKLKNEYLHASDPYLIRVHMNIGALYMEYDEYEKALTHLQQGINSQYRKAPLKLDEVPEPGYVGDHRRVAYCLLKKADTYLKRYSADGRNVDDLTRGFNHYLARLEFIAYTNKQFIAENAQLDRIKREYEVLEKMLSTAIELSTLTKDKSIIYSALRTTDLFKSSILSEYTSNDTSEVQKLQIDINAIEKRLFSYQDRNLIPDTLISKYAILRNSLDNHLDDKSNSSKYETSHKTTDYQMKLGASEDELLIYFLEAKSNVYIFSWHDANYELRAIPKDSIDQSVAYLKDFFTKPIFKKKSDEYLLHANQLFNFFLRDAIPTNRKIKNIIVVPDGELHFIPLEALVSSTDPNPNFINLDYLINDYSFIYSHSLRNISNENINKIRLGSIAVVAPLASRTKLNFTDEDKEAITSRFNSVSVYESDNICKDSLLRISESYDIIHFSTHGVIDQTNPGKSYLALPCDTYLDSKVTADEISTSEIHSKLIVLSACSTGAGKLESGEGVYSIARSFFLAGSSTLIVNLWDIDDESSSFLSDKFYEKINEGSKVDQALQYAKTEYIKTGDDKSESWSSPHRWAATQAVGKNISFSTPRDRIMRNLGVVVISISVIVVSLIFIRLKK